MEEAARSPVIVSGSEPCMPLVRAMRRILIGICGFGVFWVIAGLTMGAIKKGHPLEVPLGLGVIATLGYAIFQLVAVAWAARKQRRDKRTDYDRAYERLGPTSERTEVVIVPSREKSDLRILPFVPFALFFLAFIALDPPVGLMIGGGGGALFSIAALVSLSMWKRRAAVLRLTAAGLSQRTLFGDKQRAWTAFVRFAPRGSRIDVELATGQREIIASDYPLAGRSVAGLLENWRQIHSATPTPYR